MAGEFKRSTTIAGCEDIEGLNVPRRKYSGGFPCNAAL
jgi:hypothetical protein